MKKFLSLVLALALVLSLLAVRGEAVSTYTLTEKLERQVAIGSGFRGSMTFQISGTSDFATTWGMLTDVPLEVRAIRSGYDFETDVYAFANDIEYGRTKFFGNDLEVALVSELMPGEKIAFPIDSTLLNILFPRQENPSIISAVESLLSLTEDEKTVWADTFAPYTQEVERWLNGYASTPDLSENEAGEKVMTIAYELPFSAVITQAVALITRLASDADARALLETKLTPEQMALYLNPALTYYYEEGLKGLAQEGTLTLTREMTTLGQVKGTQMTFPLPENEWGYTSLSLDNDGDALNLEFTSESNTLLVSLLQHTSTRDHVVVDAIIRKMQLEEGEEKSLSARVNFVMRRTSTVDGEGATQEQIDVSFHAAPDFSHLEEEAEQDQYESFVDLVGYAAIQMHSKNSNLSPTYADVELGWTSEGLEISGKGTFRTSSAWVMDGMTLGEGKLFAVLPEQEQQALVDTFLEKLKGMTTTVRVVLGLDPAATPEVADDGGETDTILDEGADAGTGDDADAPAASASPAAATPTPTAPPAATPTTSIEELPLPGTNSPETVEPAAPESDLEADDGEGNG